MDPVVLAKRVRAGEVRAIAQLITLVENHDPIGFRALQALKETGDGRHSLVIGITGYPGAGKSTLIDSLATVYREQGHKIGILTIDATSPKSGGALLGDRIRMQGHACESDVFIRSMATRGQYGGMASSTSMVIDVLMAAGYDIIMVETVGVGQNEVDVASVADVVVAVVSPGLGDDIQAMKAGLFEVADMVVVNKADREGADTTAQELHDWVPHVIKTVALTGEGIGSLIKTIDSCRSKHTPVQQSSLHLPQG